MESAPKIESWTQMYLHLYSNMDAHELMLRRSQYICVLSLVNARFSILERQNPTKNAILFFFPSWARDSRQQSLTCFRETTWLFVIGIGNERNPSPTSLTVQMWVFICQEWSPTIAEIWGAPGKYKRSRFSRIDPVHPRRSEISTISSFH